MLNSSSVSANPNVDSTYDAINSACSSGLVSTQMQEDCIPFSSNLLQGSGGTFAAYEQINPELATKALSVSRQGRNTQVRNLESRMSDLNEEDRGPSTFKWPGMHDDGRSLPGELLTSINGRQHKGNGASADHGLLASKLSAFAIGSISVGSKDKNELESGLDFNAYAITIGADYRIDNQFFVGGALGLNKNQADLVDFDGELDTQGRSLSLYSTYYSTQNYFIDLVFTYGSNDFDQRRSIVYPLSQSEQVNQTLESDYGGDTYSLFIGAGYDFNHGQFAYGPRIDMEYVKSKVDEFTEKVSDPDANGSSWGTQVSNTDQTWLTLNLGGKVDYTQSLTQGVLISYARLNWTYEFKDNAQILSAHFVSDPQANKINISTDNPDRSYWQLGVGVSMLFQNGIVGFIDYGALIGNDDWSHRNISLGMRMEF
jgi:outer membrane autotransporter protein